MDQRLRAGAIAVVSHLMVVALALSMLPAAAAAQGRERRSSAPTADAQEGATSQSADDVAELRTATSRTRRNDDGTFTTSMYTTPIHYADERGRWRPIDSSLVATTQDGYAWRNAANSFGVLFKEALEDDFMRFDAAGEAFTFSLEGAGRRPANARGPRISYLDALSGVDLTYEIIPEGVKEKLVLSHAGVPAHYRFLVEPEGDVELEVVEQDDGSWAFYVPTHHGPAFVLGAPRALDAAQQGAVAPTAKPNASMKVTKAGDAFAIDVSLDAKWLHDPAREFPVVLDPTITTQPPVEDATFVGNCPSCAPIVDERLYLGTDKWYAYRPAVKFDVGDVPVGVNVTNAQLALVYDGWCIAIGPSTPHCGGVSHTINAHRITGNWTTSSTTSQATFDSTVLSRYTLPVVAHDAEDRRMAWDVTTTLKNWIAGTQPNYGIMLKRDVENKSVSGPAPPGRRYAYEPTLRPRLEVTWSSDGVQLHEPDELYANGAELEWDRYTGPSGAPFTKYEVHRSPTARFAPSDATLLATIRDARVTTYRDTTAAPNKTFSYKVVANSSVSNERRVALPASGEAKLTLQPGPDDGKAVDITYSTQAVNCANYGADDWVYIGASSTTLSRPLVGFELNDVPTNATITKATMSLWTYSVPISGTVRAHRVTSSWEEGTGTGTGNTECTGDGATWYETEGGVDWTKDGGDFDPTPVASRSFTAQTESSWHDFDLTALVQRWVSGAQPNMGVLLKLDDETLANGRWFPYYSDDYSVVPKLRPKLVVTYQDPGSRPRGPNVSIAAPGPREVVSGAVRLAAAATDDRRVDMVEFLVDGGVVATDTSVPFETTWNSTTVTNGNHTVAVRATDDAGNVTTSAGTTVRVENSAPPTVALTSPASGASVTGAVDVTANAADDAGVTKVEFLFDDVVFDTDTTAPFQASWNTLSESLPAYDGTHTLTARAYDAGDQVTTSAPVDVAVANAAGSKYRASFVQSGRPTTVYYDPGATEQLSYSVIMQVTNTSAETWTASDIDARARWLSPDDPPVVTEAAARSLGLGDVLSGGHRLVRLFFQPPALPHGVDRAQYRLRVDLFEKSTGTWFASKGSKPLENPVIVQKVVATGLGIERFYHYVGEQLGAGMGQMTNVANGNSILTWQPFLSPGRGLSTVVDLTYNSLEKKTESPVGNNFSLSVSSLARFGNPIEIHPNGADGGRADRFIDVTDGDGTTHRFVGKQAADGTVYWEEPAGVHLYVRQFSDTDPLRKWAATRPDNVTFFFDADGFPTFVRDKNGNEIKFVLEDVPPAEDPGGPKKRIVRIVDPAGNDATPASNRSFTIDYYSKAEAHKPQIRGNVQTIADHDGSELHFEYYDDGNLLRLTQEGGTKADGTFLADRSFVFTYTTSDGSAPAIPNAADRVDPNPKTPNQSTRIYSVSDPMGAETILQYYGPGSVHDRWKLQSITNRTGDTTSFAYDITNRVTTVSAPLGRVSKFSYDVEGKLVRWTNPKGEDTRLTWTTDRKVEKVIEPTEAFTQYRYNENGYLTDVWDQLGNHTSLQYENREVDPNDVPGKWKTGREIPHLSLIDAKQDPNGNAPGATEDHKWLFEHDAVGNLVKAIDPEDHVTTYTPNADGTVRAVTNARNNMTTFEYDANGLPTKITQVFANPDDNRVTQLGYDADGLLEWIQDPNHATHTGGNPDHYRARFYYDAFHRLGMQSAPKSTQHDPGNLIWSAVDYDLNDNVLTEIAPHYGPQYTGAGAKTTTAYDGMDRPTRTTGPDTSADTAGERTDYVYDDAGRPVQVVLPKGVASGVAKAHTLFFDYDVLDRVVRRTQHEVDDAGTVTETQTTHFCYDVAGDLVSITSPKANADRVECAVPPDFTRRLRYDAAHRLTSQKDALGNERTIGYDHNSNVTSTTIVDGLRDGVDLVTRREYDERNMVVKIVEPFDGTRSVTTKLEYDGMGNVIRRISPRAWDAANGGPTFQHYVTEFRYNEADELTTVVLPTSPKHPEQHYVYRAYDKNGNVTMTSLGTTKTSAGALDPQEKTLLTYFDPGWVRTHDDAGNSFVRYDYYAEGWQRDRFSRDEDSPDVKSIHWTYFPDGLVRTVRDGEDQRSTYEYDANNNLVVAHESGVTSDKEKPVDVEATWDDFDRVVKTRQRPKDGATWTFSTYRYDKNSNVVFREENGKEGAETKEGRKHDLTYDLADWLDVQVDHGRKAGTEDDQKIDNSFFPSSWEEKRVLYDRNAAGTWKVHQTTTWDYFRNGKLKRLVTKNENDTTVESHDVEYVADGVYVNGHRTKDVFVRRRTPSCDSATAPCTATFTYDPRDRVTDYVVKTSAGGTVSESHYTLDAAGNVRTETDDGVERTYDYDGTQIKSVTEGTSKTLFWHDNGNLDCMTTTSGTEADCDVPEGASPSPQVLADYEYDYLDQLISYQTFTGSNDADSKYVYDPLGRVTRQEDKGGGSPKTKLYSYLGLTNQMSQEEHKSTDESRLLDVKTYSYDAYGHRISMTDDPQNDNEGPKTYTYAYDVHGSVSLLLDDSGGARASYGYTPYGAEDDELSDGDRISDAKAENREALNPFRYTGRYHDTASGTLDMGARRFGPDTTRFLQRDVLHDALGNLSLSLDPLTQNRHALAGGNPVSFVEWDGHVAMVDGGGGGTTAGGGSSSDDGGSSDDGVSRVVDDTRDFTSDVAKHPVRQAASDTNRARSSAMKLHTAAQTYSSWQLYNRTVGPIAERRGSSHPNTLRAYYRWQQIAARRAPIDDALSTVGVKGSQYVQQQPSGWRGTLRTGSRWAGRVAGPVGIATNVKGIFDPEHEGWRGTGDRIASGAGLVSSVGVTALALGATLNPVGLTIVGAAGLGAAAWSLGNLAWDHREQIAEFAGNAADEIGDAASDVVSDIGDALPF